MSSEIEPDPSSTPPLPLSSSPPPSNPPEPTTEAITPARSDEETPLLLSAETRIPVSEGPTPPPHKKALLSSQAKTVANVIISIVGAGVLGLPYSFRRAGWVTSLLTLALVAFLTHHGMMLLVLTRRRLDSTVSHAPPPETTAGVKSFGDLGFAVYGYWGRLVLDALIVFAQAGFCVGYLLFISDTLTQMINLDDVTDWGPIAKILAWLAPKSLYIWGCFPFQLGLTSIRELTRLAPLNIFAGVANLGAMGVVIVKDVVRMMKGGGVARVDIGGLRMFGDFRLCFYGLGVSVYCFEGIGMVLALQSKARRKKRFGRLLGFTMLFIALMYAFFGALGYFAFGEETKELITANLGNGVLSTVVKLGLVINLFVKLPIMMNPVYEVVERRFWGGEFCLWLRWLLVFVVCLVAVLVPNFADFMALVGSGVCCILGFVVPSWFHLKVFWREVRWKHWLLDIGTLAMGIVLTISGTGFALLEIFYR